jgi:hypothetical protein
MITETSAAGTHAVKGRWLDTTVAAVKRLRQQGVPVLGYTWFPLFTMVDWRYRTGRGPLQDYLIELGLYESRLTDAGILRYAPTELVERYRSFTVDPHAAIGDLQKDA